jgi:hypothetical protein
LRRLAIAEGRWEVENLGEGFGERSRSRADYRGLSSMVVRAPPSICPGLRPERGKVVAGGIGGLVIWTATTWTG